MGHEINKKIELEMIEFFFRCNQKVEILVLSPRASHEQTTHLHPKTMS